MRSDSLAAAVLDAPPAPLAPARQACPSMQHPASKCNSSLSLAPAPNTPQTSPSPQLASRNNPAPNPFLLQPLHHHAIALLLAGHSDAAVAKTLSLNRTTIYRWRKCNPHFQAELNRLRQDNWQAALQRLRTLFARATAILGRCMRSKDPAQQLKAAQILLTHAAPKALAPDPAPTAPEEIIELLARQRRATKQDPKRPSPSERKDVAEFLAYLLQTDSDDLGPE